MKQSQNTMLRSTHTLSRHNKGDLNGYCKGHEIFALRNRWVLTSKVSCSGLILHSTPCSVRTIPYDFQRFDECLVPR